MKTHRWTIALAGAIAIVVVACGGGGNGDETPTAATQASPTRAAATPSQVSPTPSAIPATAPAATATLAPPTAEAAEPTQTVATPAPPPPPPPPSSEPVSLTIVAANTAFNPVALTLPASAPVSLTLDNQDAGVIHDIALFDPGGAQIAETELLPGPVKSTVNFTIGGPGTYRFTCTVHPQQMRGVITVQ